MRFRLRADTRVFFITVMLAAMPAGGASAQGLLDFLFGKPPERPAPSVPSPLPQQPSRQPFQPGQSAPGPRNFDQSISNSNTGRSTAYCVRMCDGRYFPLERFSTVTPSQMCSTLCPASPTKVYYGGGEIAGAVAPDGERYAGLKTAYLYRKQIVPNCTCNGRDIFGLASIDVKTDPTLRAGDTVSTGDGVIVVTRPPRTQLQ